MYQILVTVNRPPEGSVRFSERHLALANRRKVAFHTKKGLTAKVGSGPRRLHEYKNMCPWHTKYTEYSWSGCLKVPLGR